MSGHSCSRAQIRSPSPCCRPADHCTPISTQSSSTSHCDEGLRVTDLCLAVRIDYGSEVTPLGLPGSLLLVSMSLELRHLIDGLAPHTPWQHPASATRIQWPQDTTQAQGKTPVAAGMLRTASRASYAALQMSMMFAMSFFFSCRSFSSFL